MFIFYHFSIKSGVRQFKFFEIPFVKGNDFAFVCRREFEKFLLPKGNGSTFSLPKRKSCKKKLANLRFDRLCVWERNRAKPGKALGKASRQVGTQFPSRNRGGFRTFTRFFVRVLCVWRLSYGAPTGWFLPPKGICPHEVRWEHGDKFLFIGIFER